MKDIAKRYRAHIHNCALGDQETEMEIMVREEIGSSTFFREVGDAKIIAKYVVPVKRFGDIIGQFERPALAKIDVQGSELGVLQGMSGRLHEIDAIIVEVSILATVHDGPEVAQIISFFLKHSWSLADIVSLVRRPLDGVLAQADLLFVPSNSPLRADKRWTA